MFLNNKYVDIFGVFACCFFAEYYFNNFDLKV